MEVSTRSTPEDIATSEDVAIPEEVAISEDIATPEDVVIPEKVAMPYEISTPKEVSASELISTPEEVSASEVISTPEEVSTSEDIVIPENIATSDEVSTPEDIGSASLEVVAKKSVPVAEMVNNAILNLKERKGSSLWAIKKYINANYRADAAKLAPHIRRYLKKGVVTGKLSQVKGSGASGSFRLTTAEKAKYPAFKKVYSYNLIALPEVIVLPEEIASPEKVASSEEIASSEELASPENVASSEKVASSEELASPEKVSSSEDIATPEDIVAPEEVLKKPAPVAEMVNTAIKNLKERKGSSLWAIKKYINTNYRVDAAKLAPHIRRYLKKGVVTGKLSQVKGSGASGSFRLNKPAKPEKAKHHAVHKFCSLCG